MPWVEEEMRPGTFRWEPDPEEEQELPDDATDDEREVAAKGGKLQTVADFLRGRGSDDAETLMQEPPVVNEGGTKTRESAGDMGGARTKQNLGRGGQVVS